MVYQSFNSVAPSMTAGGPQSYQNPYYKTQCGCGSGWPQVTIQPTLPAREGFNVMNGQNGQNMGQAPMMPVQPLPQAGAPMCTLTATAPPAGCCHPAPLHCDCCNGSGFFRASEAYGS
jgi:hypothetical protein